MAANAIDVFTVESRSVAEGRFGLWGVTVNDYMVNGLPLDFGSAVVALATRRATTIERELMPLTTMMMVRNRKLKKLGDALGDLTRLQVSFKAENPGSEVSGSAVSNETYKIINNIKTGLFVSKSDGQHMTKANVEQAIQLVKSEIDKLNNEMQTDTTRVQSYVQKRDESFSMASTILTSAKDTRRGTITAMGG